jgi:hypothetical protein
MRVPRKYKKYTPPKDILEFSRISSLFIDVSFRGIYSLQLFFCSLYEEDGNLRVLQNNVLRQERRRMNTNVLVPFLSIVEASVDS